MSCCFIPKQDIPFNKTHHRQQHPQFLAGLIRGEVREEFYGHDQEIKIFHRGGAKAQRISNTKYKEDAGTFGAKYRLRGNRRKSRLCRSGVKRKSATKPTVIPTSRRGAIRYPHEMKEGENVNSFMVGEEHRPITSWRIPRKSGVFNQRRPACLRA